MTVNNKVDDDSNTLLGQSMHIEHSFGISGLIRDSLFTVKSERKPANNRGTSRSSLFDDGVGETSGGCDHGEYSDDGDEIDEQSDLLIFPVGKHVVAYDYQKKNSMSFFQRTSSTYHNSNQNTQNQTATQNNVTSYNSDSTNTTDNGKKKQQRSKVQSISCLSVSPNHKFLAICDKSLSPTDGATCTVYRISNGQRMKSMNIHPSKGLFFVAACFSGGSTKVASNISNNMSHQQTKLGETEVGYNKKRSHAVNGGADSSSTHLFLATETSFFIWLWKKDKFESSIDLHTFHISRLRSPPFSTANNPIASSSGRGCFRLWANTNSNNYQGGGIGSSQFHPSMILQTQKKEKQYNFVDHVWLHVSHSSSTSTNVKQQHHPQNQPYQDQKVFYRLVALCESLKSNGSYCVQVFEVSCQQKASSQQFFCVELLQIIDMNDGNSSNKPHPENYFISLTNHGRSGCLVSGQDSTITIYREKKERGETLMYKSNTIQFDEKQESFLTVCESLDFDQAVLFTNKKRLLFAPLNTFSASAISSTAAMSSTMAPQSVLTQEIFPNGFHQGSILDMGTAVQQPLIVTCGVDHTVRLWDYKKRQCTVKHSFVNEEPISVSIHPNGHMVLVGLKDRVRLYNVVVGKILPFREMQSKDCTKVMFSNGGQYFAVAFSSMISVYSTYYHADMVGKKHSSTAASVFSATHQPSFLLICTLVGHTGPVQSLQWSHDDIYLYSSGKDGNVYGWDVSSGTLINDTNVLTRSTGYVSMVVDLAKQDSSFSCTNNNTISRVVVCSVEGHLMEVMWSENQKEKQELRKISACSSSLSDKITALSLSVDKKFLFAGTAVGNIRKYIWPLESETPSFQEYLGHQCMIDIPPSSSNTAEGVNNGPIFERKHGVTSIHASHEALVTTGEDGSIFIFSLDQSNYVRSLKTSFNSDVVLVCNDEYERGIEDKLELERQLEDLKRDNDFALHSKDVMWQRELKELVESTDEMIKAERQRFEEAKDQHNIVISSYGNKLSSKDKLHKSELQELKNDYNSKLAIEVKQVGMLEDKIKGLEEEYERASKEEKESHEKSLKVLEQNAEKKEKNLNAVICRLKEESKQSDAVFKEILNQQEEEYEMELLKQSTATESRLYEERCTTQKMRGVIQTVNSRYDQLNKKNNELRTKTDSREQEYQKIMLRSRELENELRKAKDLIRQKEDSLKAEKNTNHKLKLTVEKLEKSHTSLKESLNGVKEEKGLCQEKVDKLKSQLQQKTDLLRKESIKQHQNDLEVNNSKLKIDSKQKEIRQLRDKLRQTERELGFLKGDIASLVEISHDQKILAETVKMIYKKNVLESDSNQK